jgi:hypothetical protein
MRTLMLLVSLEVKEHRVSSRDSVLSIYRKKPIEVGEELVALDLGILLM